MSSNRLNSLQEVNIPNWNWSPFLDHAIRALSVFNLDPYPIPEVFLEREGTYGSRSQTYTAKLATWACKTEKLRQVRAACLEAGNDVSVLNLVLSPLNTFDIPFFGADFVTLPSGHLLALDFQPVLKFDPIHTEDTWERLLPLYEKWQKLLPNGGPIPDEAKQYFSPGFLWTRLPLGSQGDEMIANIIRPAFESYLNLYLDLVEKAQSINLERSKVILEGQKRYFNYRAQKDPARGMLYRFYGKEWTESYIKKVLCNL